MSKKTKNQVVVERLEPRILFSADLGVADQLGQLVNFDDPKDFPAFNGIQDLAAPLTQAESVARESVAQASDHDADQLESYLKLSKEQTDFSAVIDRSTADLPELTEIAQALNPAVVAGSSLPYEVSVVSQALSDDGRDELLVPTTPINERILEYVFVDPAVKDADLLVDSLRQNSDPDIEWRVVKLVANFDGIDQISAVLDQVSGVDAVHLLSHSDGRAVTLGSSVLNVGTANQYAEDLVAWGQSLDSNADLLIYGCDLASTEAGLELIEFIAQNCGCDVAASNDTTGHKTLGGDWDFEYTLGLIEANVVASDKVRSNYYGTFAPIDTGLVAHYQFEEGSGTTTADSSSNANDGIFLNTPLWETNTVDGSTALSFSGDATNSNAFAEVPNSTDFNFSNGPFTVSLWYRVDTTPTEEIQLVGNLSAGTGFAIYVDTMDQIVLHRADGSVEAFTRADSANTMDGSWHHLALVVDDAGLGSVTAYVDSVQTALSGSISGVFNVDSGEPLRIGAADGANRDFEGALDEIRIYNRALPATDVDTVFLDGLSPIGANDAPSFAATLDNNPLYTENNSAVTLDADVQIFDEELSALDDFGGTTLVLERSGGGSVEDEYNTTGNLKFDTAQTITLNDIRKGVYTLGMGRLDLSFDTGVSNADVNEIMQSITYINSSDNPPGSVQLDWLFSDENTGSQGTGPALTATGSTVVSITAVNDAPTFPGAKVLSDPWINEIHYDNQGIDANEAIEIAGQPGTDLSGWTVVLYNGANGQSYDSRLLSGTIPNDGAGVGTVALPFPTNGIQNGSPDGIALINAVGDVVQFVSWEGSFTAINDLAAGATSVDIGVVESEATTETTSMQLTDSGWITDITSTFGAINTGQDPLLLSGNYPSQIVDEDVYLVFNSANLNLIFLDDVDANSAELSVVVQTINGTVTLGSTTTGVSNLVGNGTSHVAFTGTVDNINNALDGLRYRGNPDYNGPDVLSIDVDDQSNTGIGGNLTTIARAQIQVSSVNDAPMLSGTGTLTLTSINEDNTQSFGTGISDVIISAGGIVDADANSLEGIALVGADFTNGDWQYQTTTGGLWNAINTGVSDSLALLLEPNWSLRFVPDPDYNGSADIQFRAWDQTITGGSDPWINIYNAGGTGGNTGFGNELKAATISVTAVNDAPVLTTGVVNSLTADEDSSFASLGLAGLSHTPGGGGDEVAQAISYQVTSVPASSFGSVYLADGTTVVSPGLYLTGQLQGMQFLPQADQHGSTPFEFKAVDNGGIANGGADTQAYAQNITINPVNDDPVLTAPGIVHTFVENGQPVTIDDGITVVDVDQQDFNLATLTVSISNNGTPDDRLLVTNFHEFLDGVVGVAGDDVRRTGKIIGKISGGNGVAEPLVVTFNSYADANMVSYVARQVQLTNYTDNPAAADREISFTLTDGDGGTSNTVTQTMKVTPVNDAPVLATSLQTEDFEGGATGWSDNITKSSSEVSEFLAQPTNGPTDKILSKSFSIPANSDSVNISFDFYELDSWDTEQFKVYINDVAVLVEDFKFQLNDPASFGSTGNVSWTVTPVSGGIDNLGLSSLRSDQIHRVNLVVVDPGTTIKLGFGSTLDQARGDESYGVDNLSIASFGHTHHYSEGDGAQTFLPASVAVRDSDDSDVVSATVQLTDNYDNGTDTLSFTNQSGINGSWDATNGLLTLTGVASTAAYEAAIESIKFENSSQNPVPLNRTVTLSLNDGLSLGTTTTQISINPVNDTPDVVAPAAAYTVDEQTGLAIHGSGFSVTDVDASAATLRATLAVAEGDITVSVGNSGAMVTAGNTTSTVEVRGSLTELNSLLSGSSTGTVIYYNGSDMPSASTTVTLTVNDDGNTGIDPALSGDLSSEQDAASQTILINPVNDAPFWTGTSSLSNSYVENDPALQLQPGLGASDADSADFDNGQLTVSIVANPHNNDWLRILPGNNVMVRGSDVMVDGVAVGTVSGGHNGSDMIVDLNSNANVSTASTLINQLVYTNTSDSPSTVQRSIEITLTDGDGGASSAIVTDLSMVAMDDYPLARDDHSDLRFDGTDDLVTIGDNADLQLSSTATIETWLKPENLPVGHVATIVNKEGEFSIGLSEQGELLWSFASTDSGWGWYGTQFTVSSGQWTHVAVSYDNGVVNTYVNGNLVDTRYGSGAIGDADTSDNDLTFGGRSDSSSGYYFTGHIDEVRLWNTVRSQSEIAANLNTALSGTEPGLTGSWNFNEFSGNSVGDQTGNNTGSLTGGAQWTGYIVSADGGFAVPASGGPPGNDLSPDLDSVTVVSTDDAIRQGTFSISSAGNLSYDPDGAFDYLKAGEVAWDTVSYTLENSSALQDEATVTIQINGVNDAPVILNNQLTISEHELLTLDSSNVSVIDPDDISHQYIVSSVTGGQFEFVTVPNIAITTFTQAQLLGGSVVFRDDGDEFAPNYDLSVDDGTVTIGPLAANVSFTNTNDAPALTLSNVVNSLSEDIDTSARTRVADIQINDDGMGSNILAVSPDQSSNFEIVNNALYLKAGAVLDYEQLSSYQITVAVDDAQVGATPDDSGTHSLQIVDINEAPSIVLVNVVPSMYEDADTSTRLKVADIAVQDDALGSEQLQLFGADSNYFELINNELFLRAGTILHAQTQASLDVSVGVDDPTIGTDPDDSVNYSLDVLEINDPPTLVLSNVVSDLDENTDAGTSIKVADIVVQDDLPGTNVLSLSGTDSHLFELNGNALFLKAGTILDYETQSQFNVSVSVDDVTVGPSPDDSVQYSLNLVNVNEPPAIQLANAAYTLAEHADTSIAIRVADIIITDDSVGSNALSLSGSDAGYFEIVNNQLFVRSGVVLDYEIKSTYNTTIEVSDATISAGPDDFVNYSLEVLEINDPPALSLSNVLTDFDENIDASTAIKVADIVVQDDTPGTNVLSVSGIDSHHFEVNGNALFIKAGTVLDYEMQSEYKVSVSVDDAAVGASPDGSVQYTLDLSNVNEPPVIQLFNAAYTLAENSDTAIPVRVADIIVTDDEIGSNVLSLSGSDAGYFEIVNNHLFVRSGVVLDHEIKSDYNVTIEVSDATISAGSQDSMNYILSVQNLNEQPTLSNNTVLLLDENDTAIIKATNLWLTDPEDIAADLQYKILTEPSQGSIFRDLMLLGAGDIFTQQDIDLNLVSYRHHGNEVPDDQFDFEYYDTGGSRQTGSLQITIQAINDAPVIANVEASRTFIENDQPIPLFADITLTDIDSSHIQGATITLGAGYNPGQDKLSTEDTGSIASIWNASAGTLELSGFDTKDAYQNALRAVTFENTSDKPDAAPRLVSVSVDDGSLKSNSLPGVIYVASVNASPYGQNNSLSALEDTVTIFKSTDFGFSDPDEDNAFHSVVINKLPAVGILYHGPDQVVTDQVITVVDINASLLQLVPPSNVNGLQYDSFNFRVRDDGGVANGGKDTSLTANTINLDLIPVNDPPSSSANIVNTTEDEWYIFKAVDFPFTDQADNDEFEGITISSVPLAGTLNFNGNAVVANQYISAAEIDSAQLRYLPPADSDGSYTGFNFRVHDTGGTASGGLSVSQDNTPLSFDLLGVNDAPLLIAEGTSLDEGDSSLITANLLYGEDPDDHLPGELMFTLTAAPQNGELTLSGQEVSTGDQFSLAQIASDKLRYRHDGSETNSDHFDVSLADGGEDGVVPVTGRFSLNINEVIDPAPVLKNDQLKIIYGQSFDSLNGDQLDSGSSYLNFASLPDQDTMLIKIEVQPLHGTVTLNTDGSFSYEHDGSVFLQDEFSYRVTNEDGVFTIAKVSVLVEPESSAAIDNPTPAVNPAVAQPKPLVSVTSAPDAVEQLASIDPQAAEFEFQQTPKVNAASSPDQPLASESLRIFDNYNPGVAALQSKTQTALDVEQHSALKDTQVIRPSLDISGLGFEIVFEVSKQRAAHDVVTNRNFLEGLSRLESALEQSENSEGLRYTLATETLFGVSISATAGVLAWALRGGALFASVMATTPLWSSMDPIRAIGQGSARKDSDYNEQDQSVEDIFRTEHDGSEAR